MLYLFSTKHVNTQIYFCDQTKAIATCIARLAAGKLRWRCKNELVFRPQILWFVAVLSSQFGMPALRKTFGYSMQMSARRILHSDFSILPCEASETVIVVRPRIHKKAALNVCRQKIKKSL